MPKATCVIVDCDKFRVGRGYCSPHYLQVKSLGLFNTPITLVDRFESDIQVGLNGCWEWTGALVPNGYGQKWDGQKVIPAHRWSYEYHVASIPEGLQLDHLCRNRRCVNPWHLEPVTPLVNCRRGAAGEVNGGRQSAITHCPQGHEYTPENTYWRPDGKGRNCKPCAYARNRARRLART